MTFLQVSNNSIFVSSFFIKNLIFFSFTNFIYICFSTYYYSLLLCLNFFSVQLINQYFYYNFKFNFLYFLNFFKLCFKNFYTLFFIELNLDGLYYRIKYYKNYNYIGFILGYNHYILYKLNKNVFIKIHMKKRKFYIYSDNKNLLSLISAELVNLKFPNLFKGKGVKVSFYNYRLKIIKKKK
jgi:hypothetical protein